MGVPSDEATYETIYWSSPQNVQRVLTLMDTGTESMLKYGNMDHFTGSIEYIKGYGWCYIMVQEAQVTLGINQVLHFCMMSPQLLNTHCGWTY